MRTPLFLAAAVAVLLGGCAGSAPTMSTNNARMVPGDSGIVMPERLPQAPKRPHPKGFDVQGHRGARGLMPENTLAGFLQARKLGVTTLEMDAAVTADGRVVLSHEPWMAAAICTQPDGTPIPEAEERSFNLYAMTFEAVAAYDCGSRRHPDFPVQETRVASKPLLADVLDGVEHYGRLHRLAPVWYNIEIKSQPEGDGVFHPAPDEFARKVLDVVEAAGVAERTVVQSFDVRALQAVREQAPDVQVALLVSADDPQPLVAHIARLGFIPEIYSPDYRIVTSDLVKDAHARNVRVIPWTVNEEPDMRRMKRLGVDGLITDYPGRAVELLR